MCDVNFCSISVAIYSSAWMLLGGETQIVLSHHALKELTNALVYSLLSRHHIRYLHHVLATSLQDWYLDEDIKFMLYSFSVRNVSTGGNLTIQWCLMVSYSMVILTQINISEKRKPKDFEFFTIVEIHDINKNMRRSNTPLRKKTRHSNHTLFHIEASNASTGQT